MLMIPINIRAFFYVSGHSNRCLESVWGWLLLLFIINVENRRKGVDVAAFFAGTRIIGGPLSLGKPVQCGVTTRLVIQADRVKSEVSRRCSQTATDRGIPVYMGIFCTMRSHFVQRRISQVIWTEHDRSSGRQAVHLVPESGKI